MREVPVLRRIPGVLWDIWVRKYRNKWADLASNSAKAIAVAVGACNINLDDSIARLD
jgi:hypothetical protein